MAKSIVESGMQEEKRVSIIINPKAGTGNRKEAVESSILRLRENGWTILSKVVSRSATHVTDLAAEAGKESVNGPVLIAVFGGDGTLNLAARGAINTEAIVCHVPIGTVNVWGRETRTPRNDPVKAISSLTQGQIVKVDTGIINQQPFLLVAGVGLDADVFAKVERLKKQRVRSKLPYYAQEAIKDIFTYRGCHAQVHYGDTIEEMKIIQAWFGNIKRLAYITLRPEAICDDKRIEATIFSGRIGYDVVRAGIPALMQRRDNPNAVRYLQGKKFKLDFDGEVPIEYDGESGPVPTDHIEVGIHPLSLNMLVPQITRKVTIFSS